MSVKLYSSALYLIPLFLVIVFGVLLSASYDFTANITDEAASGAAGTTNTSSSSTSASAPTAIPQDADISLLPASVSAASGTGSVTVSLNAGSVNVSAVLLEMQYDQSKLANVTIAPATYFTNQTVLTNTVSSGIITLSIVPPLDAATLPTGTGTVATITFTKKAGATGSTDITFTDNTAAYGKGSVGKNIIKTKNKTTVSL